jgi:hypothetical protein
VINEMKITKQRSIINPKTTLEVVMLNKVKKKKSVLEMNVMRG